jgi:hypothetical protein
MVAYMFFARPATVSLNPDKARGTGSDNWQVATVPGSVNFQGNAASLASWYHLELGLWLVDAGQNLLRIDRE